MLNDTVHRSDYCSCAACTCKRWRKDHDHPEPLKRKLPCGCIGLCEGHGTDPVTPVDVIPKVVMSNKLPDMDMFKIENYGPIRMAGEKIVEANEKADDLSMAREAIRGFRDDITNGHIRKRQVGGSHYLDMKIQPWEIIHDSNVLIDQFKLYPDFLYINYLRNTAQKHLKRAGNKIGTSYEEDIKKAFHYLEEAVTRLKK